MYSTITIENEILYKESSDENPTETNVESLDDDGRRSRLEELSRRLSGSRPNARMSYTDEQKQLIKDFQEFFRDFDTYLPYEQPELKALGEKIMGHVSKVFQSTKEVAEEAEAREIDGRKLTREEAIKELTSSDEMFFDSKHLKKFSSKKITEKDIYKMATPKAAIGNISALFREELEKVINVDEIKVASLTIQKSASNNLKNTIADHEELFDLALAHQLLKKNGLTKEAKQLDEFILKSALWDSLKSAWKSTKEVVGTAITYAGKAVKTVVKSIGKGVAWVGRIALKGLRYLVKVIPVLGILFSLPFFIKNAIEAWKNGKDILASNKYNFERYGFERWKSITPEGAPHVIKSFRSATDKFKRSPEDLKQIVLIFRTIGSFWIDCLFAITNLIMAILDLIQIIGLFFPGPGWFASLVALGADFLFNAGIIGIEMGSEYLKDFFWKSQEDYMLKVARNEVSQILKEGKQEERSNRPRIELMSNLDYDLSKYSLSGLTRSPA